MTEAWPFNGQEWTHGWRFGVHDIEPGLGVGSRLLITARDGKLIITLQLSVVAEDEIGHIKVLAKEVDISDWPGIDQLSPTARRMLAASNEGNR